MLGSRSWHGMWQLIMSLAGLSLASTRWVTILKSTQIGRQVNEVGFVGHQTGDFWRNHDFKQTAAFFLLHNWFKDTVGKSSTQQFELNIKLVESGRVPAQTPSKSQNVFRKRAKPAQKWAPLFQPKIRMYSKYERRTDTRTYEDRRKLYEGVSRICKISFSLLRVLFAVWGFLRADVGTRPLFAFDDIFRFLCSQRL